MKNFFITVPKTKDAMNALDYDQAKKNDLIELKLNERNFHALDNTGIFSKFNELCGSLIDEYEDDSITDIDNLKKCKNLIDDFTTNKKEHYLLAQLHNLIQEAIDRNTGIFFYF